MVACRHTQRHTHTPDYSQDRRYIHYRCLLTEHIILYTQGEKSISIDNCDKLHVRASIRSLIPMLSLETLSVLGTRQKRAVKPENEATTLSDDTYITEIMYICSSSLGYYCSIQYETAHFWETKSQSGAMGCVHLHKAWCRPV